MFGIKKLFHWWVKLAAAGFSVSPVFQTIDGVKITDNINVNTALSYRNRAPTAFTIDPSNQQAHPCKRLRMYQVCAKNDNKYFPAVYEGSLTEYKFKGCIIKTASDHSGIYIKYSEMDGVSSKNDLYRKLIKRCRRVFKRYSQYIEVNDQDRSITIQPGYPIGIAKELIKYGVFENRVIFVTLDSGPEGIEDAITKFGHKYSISGAYEGISGVEKFIQTTLDPRYKTLYDIHLEPIAKAKSAVIYIKNGKIDDLNAGTDFNAVNIQNNGLRFTDIEYEPVVNTAKYKDNPFDSHSNFIGYREKYYLSANQLRNPNKNSAYKGNGGRN